VSARRPRLFVETPSRDDRLLRARVLLASCAAISGVLGIALIGLGGPSAAATTTTTTTTTSPPSSSSSASSSSSSDLGGFQVSATGAGIDWSYEQPNFPIPATPSLEFHLGYSTTSYNAGPTGESLASTMWPGQAAANIGGQLSVVLEPYFGKNTPNITVPPWPLQAATSYPPGPTTPGSASQDSPGVVMEASSTQDAGTANSSFGTSSGGSNSFALPSGFIAVQSFGSTVQSTVTNGQAVAQGTSELHGVSIAGGLITIGEITSTATSTSDGNQANVTGASTVGQVEVAGQAVTLDSSGLHAAGNDIPILGSLLPSVQSALKTAGISLSLTNPTDTVNGASGERALDGVQLTIDLTTLDKQANALVALLPKQVQSQVLSQLPVPVPDSQVMTVDLGSVDVQAAASPPYTGDDTSTSTSSDLGTGSDSALSGGSLGSTDIGSGGVGLPGTSSGGGAGTTSGQPGVGVVSPTTATTPAKLFRGIGAGLIVLGVLLALLLAGVLWRADAAVGALTGAPACTGENRETFLGGT